MQRTLLLLAGVAAAGALFAWLIFTLHVPPAATAPVAGSSRTAGGPSSAHPAAAVAASASPTPPQRDSSPVADAAVVTVPPEVVEAAEQRQTAKITRGMRADPAGGVRVDEAPPGSVVNAMHLQPGDLLMSVNNEAVVSPEDFARIYRAEGIPGEFVVMRNGRELHRR